MGRTEAAEIEDAVRDALVDALGIDQSRVAAMTGNSGLFGTLPELDSMAVATLLTALEDRLAIIIDDDDVDADMLESFGALTAFARRKALG